MATNGKGVSAVQQRGYWLIALLAFGLCAVVAKLWSMQITEHASYESRARDLLATRITLPAERGGVYDREGRPLAITQTTYRLSVNPARCTDSPAFIADLSSAANLPTADLSAALRNGTGYLVVATDLSKPQMDRIRDIARSWRADGVSLEAEMDRSYPNGRLAAHVLGFVNDHGEPWEGIELSQKKALGGTAGLVEGPTDGSGFVLSTHRLKSVPAKHGDDIHLTIDLELQQAVTEALQEAYEKHKPSTAVAIVMEPQTGDILAMVSLPDYDPNSPKDALAKKYKTANSSPLRDSAVSLVFPPGSVFKVVTIASALDSGAITMDTPTYCKGIREFGGRPTRCDNHHGTRAHGQLDPTMVMTVSCNLSAGEYAQRMGAETFVRYIHNFGCLEKPGIGLPGEVHGLLPPIEKWGNPQHELAVTGFGQSIALTPLGLLTGCNAIANQGQVVFPRLISQIGSQPVPVRKGKQVISQKVAGEVLQMLMSVVENKRGTGSQAAVPGFHVGGKTGTAQRVDPATHKVSNHYYDSYFFGVVPVDGRPKVSVLILLDEPTNGYYGGQVAAPVFKKIASYLVTRWRLTPTMADVH